MFENLRENQKKNETRFVQRPLTEETLRVFYLRAVRIYFNNGNDKNKC